MSSLGLGVVALVIASAALFIEASTFYVSWVGIGAIVWGIRAINRRRHDPRLILWAPVVGMLLGVVATLMFIAKIAGFPN